MKAKTGFFLASLLGVLPLAATAQGYPDRPVKLLVGYVPGGAPDTVARLVGKRLGEILGQTFVVDNHGGAGGTLATGLLAKAPADGYTLLLCETGQIMISPHLIKGATQYDPQKDFTPVGLAATTPLAVVTNAKWTEVKTIQDLIREAKAHPGKFNYGSSGIGSIHHIAAEVFLAGAGISMTHVAYKGSGQSVPAVLGGEVPVLLTSLTSAMPHIRSGTLRLLAVSSAKRYPGTPDTPAISEVLPGYDYASEMGILAPAGLPAPILAKLSSALKQALEDPDLQEKLKAADIVGSWLSPQAYADNMRQNLGKYERALKIANLPAN